MNIDFIYVVDMINLGFNILWLVTLLALAGFYIYFIIYIKNDKEEMTLKEIINVTLYLAIVLCLGCYAIGTTLTRIVSLL